MKRCPECKRDYYDNTLVYCLDDGNALLEGPATASSDDEPATAILSLPPAVAGGLTGATDDTDVKTAILQRPATAGGSDSSGGFDRRLLFAPLALAVIVLGGFLGYRYFSSPATKQIESIAVMPFVNESGNADVEYLSDGMTETLISSLSNLPNLNVKPRSSVFRYKGKDTNPNTIAKELNVQAILNGKVVQRGPDVSLFVELIDVALDKVVWSQQYSRKQSDLVALQSEIARDVSSKLKAKLSTADVAKVEKNSNVNAEAYQLYLKGIYQLNIRNGESLKRAAEFCQQAVDRDPNYAPAYVCLARSVNLLSFWSIAPQKEISPRMKSAASRALELDESLADAHLVYGTYLSDYEWDFIGAEKAYRRAVDLDPKSAPALDSLGFSLFLNGRRLDEAVSLAKRAIEIDPLNKRGTLGHILIYGERYDEAIAELKEALRLDPKFSDYEYVLGLAYYGKGSYQEAAAAFERCLQLDDEAVTRSYLALSLAKAGDRNEANKHVEKLEQDSSKRFVSDFALAITSLAAGKKEEAYVRLQKDIDNRSSWATTYSVAPALKEIRAEPRFKAMLKRANLPE